MKPWLKWSLFVLAIVLLVLGWIVYFHNPVVAARLPKWGWVQGMVARLGERTAEAPPEDDDPDNTKNEIPVHTAHVSVATLHRYIEGFGVIGPRPPRPGQMAGAAHVDSPIAGVVGQVLCQVGQ